MTTKDGLGGTDGATAPAQMPMREIMARDGYKAAIHRPIPGIVDPPAFNPDDAIHAWENQSGELRATWFAVADAMLDALMEPTAGMFYAAQGWSEAPSLTSIWEKMIIAAKAGQ